VDASAEHRIRINHNLQILDLKTKEHGEHRNDQYNSQSMSDYQLNYLANHVLTPSNE
jgi:hypothetical protein